MRSLSTITSDLLDTIHTKYQAEMLLSEIDTLMPSINRMKTKTFAQELTDSVRPETAELIRATLKKYNIPLDDQQGKIKYFLSIAHDTLTQAKTISLTLSFEPDESAISLFSEWAKKNLKNPIVFEFSLKRSILGGAIISFQGLYRNYTLEKGISDYFNPEIEQKPKQQTYTPPVQIV